VAGFDRSRRDGLDPPVPREKNGSNTRDRQAVLEVPVAVGRGTPSGNVPTPFGTVAVVVGGSRGIGLAIGAALGRYGLRVLLAGRSGHDLARAAEDLRGQGADVTWARADVSSPAGAAALSNAVFDAYGTVPMVLVYAAGVFGPISAVATAPIDEWESVIRTNLLGAFYITRLLVPGMLSAGWGRVIYVSSKAALGAPGGGTSAYAISKIGLNRLAAEVANEVVGTGVTANAIHPGDVKTAMWSDIDQSARGAGEIGRGMRNWAETVARTGGDPILLAGDMTVWLVGQPEVNGEFLLPEQWYLLCREGGR
jgi:NAD(P)-dependent dehydrogenase (short-subunit alcohol dehydrogenase family)